MSKLSALKYLANFLARLDEQKDWKPEEWEMRKAHQALSVLVWGPSVLSERE